MTTRAARLPHALLFGATLWVSFAGAAEAQPVGGEVLIVLAKEAAGPVHPELATIPALRRAPFNAFRTLELLDRPRVQLTAGRPTHVSLPNGRTLQIVLQQVMPDTRYRVSVSINRPNQADYLPLLQVVASPGDPFFVAGQSHQGGTLVLGIKIGARAAAAAPAPR